MKAKTLISSKVGASTAKKLYHHLKSIPHQPVTMIFEILEDNETVEIEITSQEGTMKFETGIHYES